MVIIGGYFVGAGGRFPTTSFLLFTTLVVANFLLFGLYMFLLPSEYMPMWTVYIFTPVCYCMGAGLGYGAAKWPKIGITVIGFTIGAMFGQILHAFITTNTQGTSAHWMVDWSVVVGSGLLASVICIFLFDYAVIIGSGIVGSYLLIRVSLLVCLLILFTGHFNVRWGFPLRVPYLLVCQRRGI